MVLSAGGPGSVVGIDIARTSNPSANLGVAQSMVNIGGFLATLLVLASMGALLTALAASPPRPSGSPGWCSTRSGPLRWSAVLVTRRKSRRLDAERGVVPRPLREVFAGKR